MYRCFHVCFCNDLYPPWYICTSPKWHLVVYHGHTFFHCHSHDVIMLLWDELLCVIFSLNNKKMNYIKSIWDMVPILMKYLPHRIQRVENTVHSRFHGHYFPNYTKKTPHSSPARGSWSFLQPSDFVIIALNPIPCYFKPRYIEGLLEILEIWNKIYPNYIRVYR